MTELTDSTVQRRRRICFVTVEFHGLFKNGGIGTANTALARALAANGFDVTVAIANSDESGPRLKPGEFAQLTSYWRDRDITLDYVRPHPHLAGSFDDPRSASYCVFLYVQHGGFDAVLFNDNGGQAYYTLLAKHTGVFKNPPLLCVVAHGPIDWVHELNALEFYSRQPVIMSFMEQRSASLADVLVSPSQYLLDWMRGRGWIPKGRGHVLQNLVGVDAERAGTWDCAVRLPVTEIVFFGRQETRKGITLFCDAIDLLGRELDLSSTRITFLGKFSRLGAMHSGVYLTERARRWRAPLRILAAYDQAEALDYLRRAGVLAVIPSRAENSPCVVAECLQLGLLFLATNRGGSAELVAADDRDSCLFEPTPVELAARLSDVLHNGQRRARMAVPPQDTLRRWIDLLANPADCEIRPPPASLRGADTVRITVCLVWSPSPQFRAGLDLLRKLIDTSLQVVVAVHEDASDQGRPSTEDWPGVDLVSVRYGSEGEARNAAAQHAAGDYLLFLDAACVGLAPGAIDTLALAAARTQADVLTGLRDWGADARGAKLPLRDGGLPIGGCTELGAIENCFGEGAMLVRAGFFAASLGFSADCSGTVLDWLFLASAALDGAALEVIPAPIQQIRETPPRVDDGEHTVEDHRRILRRYRQAPLGTVSRILESTLQIGRQNGRKMQRAFGDIGNAARELATRLGSMEASSVDASKLFVQYCCERRMIDLAVDFSLHNQVALLPETVTAVTRANEKTALELMQIRPFDSRHSIDLTTALSKRARPFHRLRAADLRASAEGPLGHCAPFGDSVIKIAAACPPGTLAVRLTVQRDTAGAVRFAGVVCRSWSRPVMSDDALVSDGAAWWSGWVDGAEPGASSELHIALSEPVTELLDLYLCVQRADSAAAARFEVTWRGIAVDLCLVGDITPSGIQLATVTTLLPPAVLQRGRLLTDVSDVAFPVFVPGERSLLHPLPNRVVLAQIPDALPHGATGLRCVVSVEHAQAHSIEFAVWARPASRPIGSVAELADTDHFSGWIRVDTPFVKISRTFRLARACEEPWDIYLATRVPDAADTYFCHAYWHEFSILEGSTIDPGDARSTPPPPGAAAERSMNSGTSWNADVQERPRRSYLICAAARTGSNLLANALRDIGLAGWPLEYFNAQSMHDAYMLRKLGIQAGAGDFADFTSRLPLILRAGTFKGIFGATVHWWDLDNLAQAIAQELGRPLPSEGQAHDGLPAYFPDLAYIWLRRENKVAQAISHYIAMQTGTWSRPSDGTDPGGRPDCPLEFDFDEIKKLVVSAEVEEDGWRRFLAGSERLTLALTYEELAADYAGAVSRVLAFIGISVTRDAIPKPAFLRQADARSSDWERRYREQERAPASQTADAG